MAQQQSPSALPHVHVVIPAYNAEAFVREAVESALGQRGVKVDVTVIDAGSNDETANNANLGHPNLIVHRSGVRLNAAAARNIGVRFSDAPWLSFLDADDLWPPDRTRALIAAAEEFGANIAYGHTLTFADGTQVEHDSAHLQPRSVLGPIAGSIVIRRNIATTLGPMDESLDASEFVDWMARARRLGIAETPVATVALLRRAHSSNHSRDRERAAAAYLRTVARHLRAQDPRDADGYN